VASLRAKLLVPGIGSWGQLLEWQTEMKDFAPRSEREAMENAKEGHIDSPQNGHRHSSHLLAVYPLRQISYEKTPELAAAAKVSVIARSRGQGSIGISFIHRTAIFARLYEPELAYGEIHKFFKEATPNFMSFALYDAAPALPGAIAEMLLQSHQKELHLLPALPKAWPTGNVKGLRARGGYQVDETWKDGALSSATIHNIAGHAITVRYAGKTTQVDLPPGATVTLDADLKIKN
jgi:alpha-L-fucosidase 2